MTDSYPFIILRIYGTGEANREFIETTFRACEKHPGLINEFWFAGIASTMTDAELDQVIAESAGFRKECQKHGIAFSYQQGVTLNHEADGKIRPHIPEDAWAVDISGKRLIGLFCPTAPEAKAANFHAAEKVLRELQPESYWPDDDLRLSIKPDGNCCCDRCLGIFNRRFHHTFTREQLADALKHDGTIRKEWSLSNGQNLGDFASVFREAVDKAAPGCRLGIQTVMSSEIYDGPDFYPILKALAGPENKKVGIRPGACFYEDGAPRGMLEKSLDIQREAARCARYGFVEQNCYEAENWPHVGSEKNPYLQMNECALMLASGCNSLALYWGTDSNAEAPELSMFYFDAVAEYKPYFEAIRKAFEGTTVSGMALYHGENYYNTTENWKSKRSMTETRLMENALPVTCTEGNPEMLVLNDRCVEELGPGDFEKCFSQTVLMDISSFRKLAERFPQLDFLKQVTLLDAQSRPLDSGKQPVEVFENTKRAVNFWTAIRPESPDVRTFSAVSGIPGTCGTCLFPTGFGGHIVLVQTLDLCWRWTGYRRTAILDAIDSVKPLSVRLLTNGFCVSVTGRRDASGKTAGAFLVNMGCGRTMPLKIALRNPAFRKYMLYVPGEPPAELKPLSMSATEAVFEIPSLPAWQSVMIAGETEV